MNHYLSRSSLSQCIDRRNTTHLLCIKSVITHIKPLSCAGSVVYKRQISRSYACRDVEHKYNGGWILGVDCV